MSLDVLTEQGGGGGGRRVRQEFRDLCRKFDGGKESGVMEGAKLVSGLQLFKSG